PSGGLVFLLTDEDGAVYAGDAEGLTPLPGARTGPTGRVLGAVGYTPLTAARANERGAEVAELAVPAGDGAGIRAQGLSAAYEGRAARAYDAGCDCITDSATGAVYTADDEHGVFATEDGERLSQGWRDGAGADNDSRLAALPRNDSDAFTSIARHTVSP